MIQIIFGQIPEAIFFAIFMLKVKRLEEHKIKFILLMVIEYLLLKSFMKFSVYFQICYTIITFLLLKILYKNKAQITDIFTFGIGSIFIIVTSAILFSIANFTFKNVFICNLLHKILIFVLLYIYRNKLYKVQNLYKSFWNRNYVEKKKIKSVTFRAVNISIFNIMFYLINIGMIFIIIHNMKLNGGV